MAKAVYTSIKTLFIRGLYLDDPGYKDTVKSITFLATLPVFTIVILKNI